MPSIPNSYISAALFDLKQDIIADIPRDVIERWLASEQNREDALAILEPFKVEGFVLSSDTSGLSKLSQQRRLIEVLSIVSHPKEIVHAYGSSIGGNAVGVWAADNTQMFFKKNTSVSELIATARAILREIENRCEVKIGMGLHYGVFYRLGGGLYGSDADFVEGFTEELVKGGELWISDTVRDLIGSGEFVVENIEGEEGLYRVADGKTSDIDVSLDVEYPLPFSREFYNDLRALRDGDGYDNYLADMESRYLQECCVVLVERNRLEEGGSVEVSLLNDLSLCAVMENDAEDLLAKYHGEEVKVTGPLGIYIFNDTSDAVLFAQDFRESMSEKSVKCRIGVDRGYVLVCQLPNGARDIAGGPVNIASKLAQDAGVFGKIHVSDSCRHAIPSTVSVRDLVVPVSGVTINAVEM